MKGILLRTVFIAMVTAMVVSCASSRQPKKGCPTNSSNMGAERVLSGEKPAKQSKFKIKGMN